MDATEAFYIGFATGSYGKKERNELFCDTLPTVGFNSSIYLAFPVLSNEGSSIISDARYQSRAFFAFGISDDYLEPDTYLLLFSCPREYYA
jgi:hypothetical protein